LLQEAIIEKARTAFADGAPEAVLRIDAVVDPDDLREDLAAFLDQLEPCGNGNPRPVLALRGAEVIRSRRVGSDARHLKLTVRAGRRIWDAIAFRQADDVRDGSRLDLGFLLERNDYLGVPSLQLNVVSLRESSAGA
jgi:single-stranded-DNA-specific exonuclease